MDEAAAELLGGIGKADQLIRVDDGTGDLDPLHLHALLPLGIRAELQPDFLHLHFAQLAAPIRFDVFLELGQLLLDILESRHRHDWPPTPRASRARIRSRTRTTSPTTSVAGAS